MKNVHIMKKISIFLFTVLLFACVIADAQTSVTMVGVDNITSTTATFNGNISNVPSGTTVNKRGFYLSTSPNYTANFKKLTPSGSSTAGDYSFSITTVANYLSPSTTYYVKAWARMKTGSTYDTVFSSTVNFVSLPFQSPALTADSVTNMTLTSARLNGTIVNKGDAYQVTGKGFVYSTTSNPTMANGNVASVSGSISNNDFPKSFIANLSNLPSGTTFYYRTYAISKINNTLNDTCYSVQKTFKTPESCDSIPYDLIKDSVTITEAFLSWKPRIGQANFEIDYGYAGHTPGEGSSVIVHNVTNAHLTGLTGGRSYSAYVRAVCENSYSDWSIMASFTTDPSPCADVTGLHTTDVGYSSAIITWTPGNITQNNWEVLFAKASDNYPSTPMVVTNNPVFSPIGLTPTTQYKVKVRANCGVFYSGWSDDLKFTTLVMGLEEDSQNQLTVLVYPNPSNGEIYFDKQQSQVNKIEIYNSLGAKVFQSDIVPESLNLSKYGKGLYFVQITTDRGWQTEKIVIK